MGVVIPSDFSQQEIESRVSRVRHVMKERGLDALLAYDEGGIIGGGSARYLAGFSHVAPPIPSWIAVGQSGSAVLIHAEGMGKASVNWDEIYCPKFTKVHTFGGNALAPAVAPGLVEGLKMAGFTKGRVGVDLLNQMRAGTVAGLRQALEGNEIVDASRLVEYVRREKSEAELENYRRAGALSKRAMEMFMEVVQPGIKQDVATAVVHEATAVQGAETLGLIHGCGDPWFWGHDERGELTFEEGDLVACELNARYHGYYAQVCRTWTLGKARPEKDKLLSAVRAAEERMLTVIKPGMTGREVYLAGLDEIKKRGYDFCAVRFGHGLGLTIGEGYDFADWDSSANGPCTAPLVEGMFGVFHPFLIERGADGRGKFNALWGDPWVLRAHGPEHVV